MTYEPGDSRKARKTRTYTKMARVGPELSLALVVKTADRLANIEACVAHQRSSLLDMYRGEHGVFKAAVYRPDLCEMLWRRLDDALEA